MRKEYEEFEQASFPGNGNLKANARTETNFRALHKTQRCRTRTGYSKNDRYLFQKRSMIYTFIKKMKRHFRLKRCKVLRK
jgi:hypothetical protein